MLINLLFHALIVINHNFQILLHFNLALINLKRRLLNWGKYVFFFVNQGMVRFTCLIKNSLGDLLHCISVKFKVYKYYNINTIHWVSKIKHRPSNLELLFLLLNLLSHHWNETTSGIFCSSCSNVQMRDCQCV